jgi:hypothetical protein
MCIVFCRHSRLRIQQELGAHRESCVFAGVYHKISRGRFSRLRDQECQYEYVRAFPSRRIHSSAAAATGWAALKRSRSLVARFRWGMDAASKAQFHRLHHSRFRGLSCSRSRVRGHSDSLVANALSSRSSHAGFQSPSWRVNLLKCNLIANTIKVYYVYTMVSNADE